MGWIRRWGAAAIWPHHGSSDPKWQRHRIHARSRRLNGWRPTPYQPALAPLARAPGERPGPFLLGWPPIHLDRHRATWAPRLARGRTVGSMQAKPRARRLPSSRYASRPAPRGTGLRHVALRLQRRGHGSTASGSSPPEEPTHCHWSPGSGWLAGPWPGQSGQCCRRTTRPVRSRPRVDHPRGPGSRSSPRCHRPSRW